MDRYRNAACIVKKGGTRMVVKLIGGILIVMCGMFTGMYLSGKTREKTLFLQQYISFLTQTKAMIEYSGENIGNVLLRVHSVPLMDHLIGEVTGMLDSGVDFASAWIKAAGHSAERNEFDRADLPLVMDFGDGFGERDAAREGAKIQLVINNVTSRLEQSEKDSLIKQRLYRTVGTFCGILIAVVLI